ncbi:MAG: SIS domain-containing protein [Rhabdochlamydiaceae bacterium]|nr:SIS domain-containing protein [Rhabdochlamydiaceae bacterium]
MQNEIEQSIADAILAIEFLRSSESLAFIEQASSELAACFQRGGKVLIAGNGGSLCDAMHFAEELTGQFRHRRKALPAIAFADPGHMSCVANDMGFDEVFARNVEAFGNERDLFIALTTSGNSSNLIKAVATAKAMGLKTICFLGKTGGKLKGMSDLEWIVPGFAFSDRIQEAHMTAIHIIIEMVEKQLFSPALECSLTN